MSEFQPIKPSQDQQVPSDQQQQGKRKDVAQLAPYSGPIYREDSDNALERGWRNMRHSVGISASIASGDYDSAAQQLAQASRYRQLNPSSREGAELSRAWDEGEGVWGGISGVAGEFAKDWQEAPNAFAGLRATGKNLLAMGAGIVEQTPNMLPGLIGMVTGAGVGAKGGALAGGVAGPKGAAVGGAVGGVGGAWAGGAAGNALLEGGHLAQQALSAAGVDPQDTAAVARYLAQHGDEIAQQAAIKGGVISAVDVATAGLGRWLLNAPARAATGRALATMGVDAADRQAVKQAMASPQFAELIAKDSVYAAQRQGGGNLARNVGAAALDPAGEFAGEYVGTGLATGEWDAKDATLEALSSVGQSAGMFALQKGYQWASRPAMQQRQGQPHQAESAGAAEDQAEDAPLMLGNTPDPLVVFPDGTVGRRAEVDAYINSLPEQEQVQARASLLGYGEPLRVKPSEAMGLRAEDGPMSAAAVMAVDSGASPLVAQASQSPDVARQPNAQALWKVAQGKARFLSEQSAQAFVDGNGLSGTHSIALRGNVFEVVPHDAGPDAAAPAPEGGGDGLNEGVVLQNRDRSTVASIEQMNAIASSPDYLRTGQGRTMDQGAPVVFGDFPQSAVWGREETVVDGRGDRVATRYAVVDAADVIPSNTADGRAVKSYATGEPGKLRAVAGNGRAAGLIEAYRRGTADQYRQELMADAQSLGIDPSSIEAMAAPMLVRVMDGADVTPDIGDRSNTAATARLSPVEEADNDARRIDLAALEFDDGGNPTPASMRGFINAMPEAERGNMLNPDGTPTRQAVDRLMAASFRHAYGNDELVKLHAQATDPEARTVMTALADSAGAMAQLADTGEFDIRQAVADAAALAVNARRKGRTLAQEVQNHDLDMNPEAFAIAQFMAQNIRSAKRMAEGLRGLAQRALEQAQITWQNDVQGGMFGDQPTLSRAQIFEEFANAYQQPAVQSGAGGAQAPQAFTPAARQERQPDSSTQALVAPPAAPVSQAAVQAGSVVADGRNGAVVQQPAGEAGLVWQEDLPKSSAGSFANRMRMLVRTALGRKDGNKAFIEIAPVSDEVAARIKQQAGLDVAGFSHSLDESAIRHIIGRHGNQALERARGQEAVTENDFARLPEVVAAPDKIERGHDTDDGRPTVVFQKRIGGAVYYVQEVRSRRRKLAAQTLWKTRDVPPAAAEAGLAHTSETPARSASTAPVSVAPAVNTGNGVAQAAQQEQSGAAQLGEARAVAQLRNYDGSLNEIEDIEGEAANASDMKAAASGDPMILEETRLRNEIKRLEALRAAHADTAAALAMQARIKGRYAQEIGPQLLETLQALAESAEAKPAPKEGFAGIGVNGKVISDRAQAVDAIQHSINRVFLSGGVESFVFRGVDFTLERAGGYVVLDTPTGTIYEGRLDGERPPSPSGFITRMGNYVDRLPALVEDVHQRIEQAGHEAKALREQAGKPFESALALEKAKALHKKVQRALIAKGPSIPQEQKAHLDAALVRQRQWLQENGYAQALAEFGAVSRDEEGLSDGQPVFSRSDDGETEAERQFEETERAYGGKAAYEKAKAAGKTKLSYGQWVQVRTPNFKQWFGDWEGLRAQQRLDEMNPVDIALPDALKSASLAELREAVKARLDALAESGVVAQHPDVGEIGFSKGNNKKALSTSALPEKLHAAHDIVRVIESAVHVGSALSGKLDEVGHGTTYHTLAAKVRAAGKEFVAVVTVKQSPEGKKFYNTVAVDDGQEKAPAASPGDRAPAGVGSATAFTGAGRSVLPSLRRVNPDDVSKATDPETGEPLAAYLDGGHEFEQTARAYGGRQAYEKAKAEGRTKLNYHQWVQVRTPAFKKWWGYDWEQTGQRRGAEKGLQRDDVGGVDRVAAAADAGNGGATGQVWGLDRDTAEPRLWFHGTKDDIAAFDLEHPNRKDKGWLGKGVYVTDSVDLAEIYAHNKRGEDGANVMPLFVAVRNPYVADVGLKKRLRYANAAQVSAFTKALQERGFDGVVVRLAEDAAEMVAFEPTAVKSAIGNSGDFDAQNPDIRYSQSAKARLDALQSLSADGMRQSHAQARASEAAHVAVVERVAQKIVARWANAPRVVVVAGMQDAKVPRVVREHDAVQKSQGAKGEPQGFFYQGQVYLVAGQLKTSRDVARVLMHEALGHYGLRGVFGGSLSSILNRLTLARRAQVVAKAREYGLHGLSKQQAGQASDAQIWQAMTSRQRLEAAEEVLAELAQRQPRLGLVREAVAAIRAWLREHVPALRHWLGEMSDDEIIREFILPARDWVQRGPQAQAAGALPAFQRAWHGSPHRGIEKEGFKLHKMGTGEGAQAYGWGMYFASQREVAEHYRTMNSGEVRIDGQLLWGREGKGPATTGNARADELLRAFDGNLLAAIEDAAFFEEHEAVAALEALVGRVQRTQPGQLYRVEIPEDGDLLDWDKPLSEQPSKVREAVLASPVIGRESDGWRGAPDGMAERSIGARAGKEIYFDLVARFGTDGDAAREASEHLGSLGIPGLRYLDGLSRDGLGGGHNYVIWDEALLTPEAAQIEPMYNRKARFFSALEHAVAGLPMKAGDAAAWRQQIAGLVAKGQVKQDEVFWSGVQDWLDAQSGKIAREAVQHYLKNNHVRFGESSAQWTYTDTAGNKQSFDSEEEARKSYEGELEWIENEAAGVSEGDDSLTLWTNWDDSAAHFDKEESDQWVNEEDDDDVIDSPEENFYISRGGSAEEDGDTLKIYDGDGDLKDVYVRQKKEVWNGYRNGYPEYAWEGIESREEALEILEEEAEKIREGLRDEMSEPEKSGLASTRQIDFSGYSFADKGGNYREVLITASGDRVGSYKSSHWNPSNVITHVRLTDFDDGQTLFVEELQSDWAQDARAGKTEAKAPFVDSTGKWLDLALKRVLIEAVNGGYTRVALIDGQQSVERYSLDKQISRMDYANGELVAHRKDGGRPIRHKVDEKGLASVIGKEAAERLLSASPRDGVQSIEGEDLKMGGEGMRAFYDRIVPRALEKLLKKADKSIRLQARAQGETEQEQLGFEVTDALADKIAAGVPMFSRKSPDDAGSNQVWEDVQKARILQGEPVASVRLDDAPSGGYADVVRWAAGVFKQKGGKAISPDIGEVLLNEQAARDSMAHGGANAAKKAAFGAVKDVLERGALVYQASHGETDSFYISAPVSISGQDNIVTALVRRDVNTQRMYLHSVMLKENLLKPSVSAAGAKAPKPHSATTSGDSRSLTPNTQGRKADSAEVAAELRRLLSLDVQGDASGDGLPMFSRSDAAEQTGKVIGSVARTSIMKSASHKLTDWLKVGLQFLGRRHLVEIYGKDLPMAEYERLADWMAADANHVSAAADDLAQRWGKLKDEAALAELMHDATLAQIDADSRVPYAEGDDRVKSRHLKGRFDALSREAQEIYREVRQSYQEHYEQVQQAMKDRILRSAISAPRRARLLQKMDAEFFGKVKGVYFPLARFGQYVVAVRDAAGEVVSVSRAETMAEADAMRQQMRQAWPAQKGFSVGRVTLSKDFVAGRDMVGRGFMSELYGALEKTVPAEQLAELEDTLGQLYLASLPDLSWAKHGIHRKGTPGFSQDARRAFAQNTVHGARYLAKLRYGDRMQEELERMQKHVDERGAADESYDQPKMQRVVDEMSKRHEAMMNPKVSPISTALTSAGFLFYLGLSPASAMVNLTQTPLVAYPIMGGKWGFGKAAAALLRASKEAAANKNDIRQSLGDKQEIAAYEQAVRAGVIDVTMAHDLAGIAQGEDSAVMWKIRPVMRLASFMFHHAERFNRQTTFMAAYRLARQAGAEHDAAYEQAVDVTYRGHFDYSVSNRPRVMQGNVARVVLLFKQFSVNMIFTLARQAYMSVAGESPQVRKEARKVFAALMATHAMAAGVLGLPLVGVLLAMASALGGSDDEPWDAEVAMRNLMAQAFGPKASEVIAKGLSRLTPVDISGRVGLDHLIFPDVQEGLSGQRWAESLTTALLGPVVGIGVNWAKGAQKMADGDYLRALEDFMPVAARSAIKSYRYWDEGAQDRSGISIKDEVGVLGLVGQLAGFSPSEVRLAFEGKKAVMDADRKLNVRRSRLLAQFAQAAMHKDTQGMQEARDAIRAFNRVNPGRRITAQHMHQSVQGRRRRVAGADNGVYLPRTRRDAMQAGAFAWEQ